MVMHEVAVQAFHSRIEGAPLTLVQRTDEDFIAGVQADLATDEGNARLRSQAPAKKDGALELFQPVHRAFTLALAEVFCKEPGFPRLDPAKIESAGLVVRRVRVLPATDRSVVEAWMKSPDGKKRWTVLRTAEEKDRDPDPKRRSKRTAGNAEIDRLLAAFLPADDAEEHVTSLFIAPRDLCSARKRTLLYGLVPTASADTSEVPEIKYDAADLEQVVPDFLKQGPAQAMPSDIAGKTLDRYDADRLEGRPFMTMLALLTVALGLFPRSSSSGSPLAGQPLRTALDRLSIDGRPGGDFLAQAARVLVWRTDEKIHIPSAWPAVPADVKNQIRDAMGAAFQEQASKVVPNEGRFEVARAEYVARAFVRVKRPDGCPPVLVWGAESEPFRIRPWHASGPLPPHRVTLPDLVPDRLDEVKPNVAFVVPPKLAGFMNGNTAKALLKGSGGPGIPGLGWICGFNIPIITICAFIVLSIFLSLLHIIFWWLPFVKICIPFPSSLAMRLKERDS